MKFVELTDVEFKKFEQKQSCGNFFQTSERAELRRKMGWNVFLLGVKDDDKVMAGCLLMERNGEALVQLGPILDYDDTKVLNFWLKSLLDFCQEQNFVDLEVFPPVKICIHASDGEVLESFDLKKIEDLFDRYGFEYMGRTIALENKANRWMVIKNLGDFKNIDEIRASYKKNVRSKLRKIRPDLEIYELKDKSEIPIVADIIDQSNVKNGVVSRRLDYYEYLWDAWGDKVRFIVARKKDDKKAVATRILFYHPNEVVSFISGTAQQYKRYNGMTLLQDWLFEDCLEKGIKRVNLYGLPRGEFTPDNKLLEFKSGFGIVVEEYLGGYRFIFDQEKYNRNLRIAKIKGFARKIKHVGVNTLERLRKDRTKTVRKVVVEDESKPN